jgi:tol-pal system protein YbgF
MLTYSCPGEMSPGHETRHPALNPQQLTQNTLAKPRKLIRATIRRDGGRKHNKEVHPANLSLEGGIPLRIRWISLALIALVVGALGGEILAPQPANAVNRDMVELQQSVQQLLTNQQDMRSAMDANNATVKTLIQQSMDTVGKLSGQMDSLQKTVQDVQANTGSRIDSMSQQTQGISDNVTDLQSRVGKLSQQLSDLQNQLQSIDAKVSGATQQGPPPSDQPGGTPGAAPNSGPGGQGSSYPQSPSMSNPNGSPSTYNMPNGAPNSYGSAPSSYNSQPNGSPYASAPAGNAMMPAGLPPISADTLYHNALRDYTTGNYDLSRQEFTDYIGHFPSSDLASNSQFYLGEIFYAQKNYTSAIKAYDLVMTKYPQSIKLAAALLKKAEAENTLKERTSAVRDLREVVHRFPGSDESRRARSILQGMGVSATEPHSTTSR